MKLKKKIKQLQLSKMQTFSPSKQHKHQKVYLKKDNQDLGKRVSICKNHL